MSPTPRFPHLPGKLAGKENLHQLEIISPQLRVWMEQPLEQTLPEGLRPSLLPGERCTERWDTPPWEGFLF